MKSKATTQFPTLLKLIFQSISGRNQVAGNLHPNIRIILRTYLMFTYGCFSINSVNSETDSQKSS